MEGTEGMIHTKASQGVRIASDSFSTKTHNPKTLIHIGGQSAVTNTLASKMFRAVSNTSKTLKEMWRTKMLLKRRQEIEQGRKAVLATVKCNGKVPRQEDHCRIMPRQSPDTQRCSGPPRATSQPRTRKHIGQISEIYQQHIQCIPVC